MPGFVVDLDGLELIRSGVAVGGSLLAVLGGRVAHAVFEPVEGVFDAAGGVDHDDGLGLDLLAELDEFIGAELIGVAVVPLVNGMREALFARADAVLPDVPAGKRSAGPADGGGLKVGDGLEQVRAIAAGGQGRGGEEGNLVDIDRPRRRATDHQ